MRISKSTRSSRMWCSTLHIWYHFPRFASNLIKVYISSYIDCFYGLLHMSWHRKMFICDLHWIESAVLIYVSNDRRKGVIVACLIHLCAYYHAEWVFSLDTMREWLPRWSVRLRSLTLWGLFAHRPARLTYTTHTNRITIIW